VIPYHDIPYFPSINPFTLVLKTTMALLSSLPTSVLTIQFLFLTLITTFLLRILIRAFATPLRNIPGPFLARFTRFWKLREYYRGAFEKTNIALHRTYGMQHVQEGSQYTLLMTYQVPLFALLQMNTASMTQKP
jgi:hypothetical protein